MWGWFGGQSAQKRKDAPKKAILELRENLDMLQKREKHLQTLAAEQDAIARKNITSNKAAAKAALVRKKRYEGTIEQTGAQINQLEQQIFNIEAANINKETLTAMKNAGAAMKQIHGGLTIEQVDDTMEQLREQHALGEEIANAITNTPLGDPVDEAELEEELEGLEQEAMDERMLKTGTVPVSSEIDKLPAVHTGPLRTQPQHQEEDEEEELRKLQAEMAM